MDEAQRPVAEFLGASNVLIVAGKGGVGKTTVCACVGLAAARAGHDVLLVELEGRSTLGSPFGHGPLEYDEQTILRTATGRVRARQITPDEALADYLGAHGLERVSGRLSRTGAIEVVSTAAPGIRDLLALGRIRSLEQERAADVIVVDAPAAGHAISFLKSPAGLLDSASGGPVRHQAEAALALLGDDARCRVMLVTTPEETPVLEATETAFALEEEVGVKLAPIVLNGLWPVPDDLEHELAAAEQSAGAPEPAVRAARFRLARARDQALQVDRLRRDLPLPHIPLPHQFTPGISPHELDILARHFSAGVSEVGSP